MARRSIGLLAIFLRVNNTDLLAQDDVPKLAVLVDSAAVSAVFWNAHRTWVEHGDLWVVSALHVHFSPAGKSRSS